MIGMKSPRSEQAGQAHRVTAVYLMLVVLTLLTWGIGHLRFGGLSVSLFVLGVALLKGHLIGDWFMGLRRLRGVWRWVIVIWLLVPAALITVAFALTE